MEISNRTIATLLIATIVIYLGGTFISLNRLAEVGYAPIAGYATSSPAGNVNLTITTTASVIWVVSTVNWSAGYVNSTCTNCTMFVNDSDAGATGTSNLDRPCCINFAWMNESLLLRNNGNVDVNVQMNVSQNASDWFGTVAGAEFAFKIVDTVNRSHQNADTTDTAISCNNNTAWNQYDGNSWTQLNTFVGAPLYVCGDANNKNFTYIGTKNEANFDFKVVIPVAYTPSATSAKSSIITILATS